MLRSLTLLTRTASSSPARVSPKPAKALLKPNNLVRPLKGFQATRSLYTPSTSMRYPIITKDNADPEHMEPMKPIEEDLLDEPHVQDEHKLLEHDLEEDDFVDRDDDDMIPEEHINTETGERGGPKGYEPTRFGDWAKNGRVSDF